MYYMRSVCIHTMCRLQHGVHMHAGQRGAEGAGKTISKFSYTCHPSILVYPCNAGG